MCVFPFHLLFLQTPYSRIFLFFGIILFVWCSGRAFHFFGGIYLNDLYNVDDLTVNMGTEGGRKSKKERKRNGILQSLVWLALWHALYELKNLVLFLLVRHRYCATSHSVRYIYGFFVRIFNITMALCIVINGFSAVYLKWFFMAHKNCSMMWHNNFLQCLHLFYGQNEHTLLFFFILLLLLYFGSFFFCSFVLSCWLLSSGWLRGR